MANTSNRTGCGERTEIGRIRKAGRSAANPVERFDPEGCNSPEGEWKSEEQPIELAASEATGLKRRSGPDRGEPVRAVERKGRTGRTPVSKVQRSSRSGTLTLEWRPRKGQSLQASERPLRAPGSVREKFRLRRASRLRSGGWTNQLPGSRKAKRPALPIAVLRAVHAGGEQGWKSDHLEPFSFSPYMYLSPGVRARTTRAGTP